MPPHSSWALAPALSPQGNSPLFLSKLPLALLCSGFGSSFVPAPLTLLAVLGSTLLWVYSCSSMLRLAHTPIWLMDNISITVMSCKHAYQHYCFCWASNTSIFDVRARIVTLDSFVHEFLAPNCNKFWTAGRLKIAKRMQMTSLLCALWPQKIFKP